MTTSPEPIRVVCVDDNPAFVETIATVLSSQDERIEAVGTTDPERALDAVEGGRVGQDGAPVDPDDEAVDPDGAPVDCVVSDYRMPGTTGLDLLEAVREREPELPFVLFTGEGSEAVAAEAIAAGVTQYVPKQVAEPFDVLTERVIEAVESRRSRDRLELTRETYRSLLDAAPVPVWVQELETILYANESAAEMYGVDDPAALVGESALELVPEEDHEDVLAANREMLDNSGSATALEGPFRRANGDVRYGLFAGACISFRGEDALIVIARDITDRQEREESLRERNERLEEFASVLSHDLRNPLAVAAAGTREARRLSEDVRGTVGVDDVDDADGADDGSDPPDEEIVTGAGELDQVVDYLDQVVDAHDRMDEITDRLLRLARNGRTVEDPVELSLATQARQAWGAVETGEAELVIESDRRLRADPGRFAELLENLFANAREHGDATAVRVSATPTGFAVTDDGAGVPEAVRERAFESGYTTDSDGTGFGLAIVERIASAHGWTVGFDDGDDGNVDDASDGGETDEDEGGEGSAGARIVIEGVDAVEGDDGLERGASGTTGAAGTDESSREPSRSPSRNPSADGGTGE